MTAKEVSTRERIRLAAIEAIEEHGIDQVTTRLIAQEAGTNIASINYHFRTKDDLIAEVLQSTADHMLQDVFAELEKEGRGAGELLEEVLFYLIDGCRRFPGITTAHLYSALIEKDYESPGAEGIQRAFEGLVDRISQLLPRHDPARIRNLLSWILGSIMFTMLTPGFLAVDPAFHPNDEVRCRRLANSYTEIFLASV